MHVGQHTSGAKVCIDPRHGPGQQDSMGPHDQFAIDKTWLLTMAPASIALLLHMKYPLEADVHLLMSCLATIASCA
jgi:hypothetical protein